VDFTPGHRAVVFRIGRIRLGDVICYEVGFDNLVSSEVSAGANLLTEQTNDADFEMDGKLGETLQQLAMARVRAIEFDRAMIVAGTTGVSAIIAPDGSLIAHTRTWQRAVIQARVPLLSGSTAGRKARPVARARAQRARRRGPGLGRRCGGRGTSPVAPGLLRGPGHPELTGRPGGGAEMSPARPARCSAEPVETVQEQVQRELEFELVVAALSNDGRFVVVYRLSHFGDVRVSAFHLAD